MIQTSRLHFSVRSICNVSLFYKRACPFRQRSKEFSFFVEPRKENYLHKKLCKKIKYNFSSFKELKSIEPEKNQQKSSVKTTSIDHIASAQHTQEKANLSGEPSQKVILDLVSQKNKSIPINKSLNVQVLKNISTEEFPSEKCFPQNLKVNVSSASALKILKAMAITGQRPTNELKYLSISLAKNLNNLTFEQCIDVLYALGKLSFPYLPLLNSLSESIIEYLSKNKCVALKPLVSILGSLGKLKYRNCELIEILCKKIIQAEQSLSLEKTTGCLLALTNLNIRSVDTDHFLQVLTKLENTDFTSTKCFLNYIWCSVILEKENFIPVKHLERVLSKGFIEQLAISGDHGLLNKIKLLHINGVASSMKNYKGPILKDTIVSPVISKSKNTLLLALKDSLSYIFPKTGFLEPLSYIGSGIFIDVECCVDSKCNPVLLRNKENNHKIGIVILNYNDFCLENNSVTGLMEFRLNKIKKLNYKVLTIPYNEFPLQIPLSDKIAYLRQNIKKLIG